jgi:ribose 5-phosphate isomerase A
MTQREHYKQQAAERAVEFVESGMLVGLGTGSTAIYATRRIGALLREGKLQDITGIATSAITAYEAEALGIPLLSEDVPREIDLTIDGADEIDPSMNLIKGAGGALLREKIVAQASRRVVIVAEEEKLSRQLGNRCPLPVETLSFGWRSQLRFLESLQAQVTLRLHLNGQPFLTDSGNYILDCRFPTIEHPADLAHRLGQRAGIVEHGLFLGIATDVVLAGPAGLRHERK